MPLRFRDTNGIEGEITDEMEVHYDGNWDEEVEMFVDEIDNGDLLDRQIEECDLQATLLIELPAIAPIVSVERDVDRALVE